MRTFRLALAIAAALLGAAACSDSTGSSGGGPGTPRLEIVSGDAQQGTAGAELAAPLVVRVTNDKGKPVSGQVVNFVVVSGGGHVFAGTGITDANGEARERWTLGNVAADSQKVEARAVNTSTGAPLVFATFRATATPDVPASVGPAGSASFAGLPGLPLADSVGAVVRDRFGNAVPGVAVVWTVQQGGGSVSPATSTTGADGVARARWTLGPQLDSTQVLQAAAGLTVTTQFTANARVPVDAVLVKVSGDAQADSVGRLLAQPLVVRVQRADGTPVAGIPVSFAGAGSVNPATVVSDAGGLASTHWTLPTTTGAASATATIATFSTVTFTATAVAGPAATLEKVAGEGQQGTAGTTLRDSLAVRARDAYGNPVAGVQVTWSAASGTVSPATSATRADGTSRAAYTLPPASGTFTVQASAPGVPAVTFSEVSNAGQAVYLTILSPAANAVAGDTLPVSVRIDSSSSSVTGVQATVAGRSIALAATSPGVVGGKLPLIGLPSGSLELQVRATTAAGDTVVVTRTFIHDTPPVVLVTHPLNGEVSRGTLRIDADCTDDDPAGCSSIKATVKSTSITPTGHPAPITEVASGTTGIHTTVDLTAYDGATLELAITGTDSRGQQTVVRDTIYVETSGALTELRSAGKRVIDADSTQLLFLDNAGALVYRSGGTDQQIAAAVDPRHAMLHSQGAVYVDAVSSNGTDLYAGTLSSLGRVNSQALARGNWLIWSNGTLLFRRDLAAGTTVQVTSDAVNNENDVTATGEVVYTAGGSSAGNRFDIYRYLNGVTTALTNDADNAHWNLSPVTDGTNVVYFKTDQNGNANTSVDGGHITLLKGGVETFLATVPNSASSPSFYAVNNGWVAYLATDLGGVLQLHVRDPGGVDHQFNPGSSQARIVALSRNGSVLYSGSGLFLARPPYTAPVQISHVWSPPPGARTFAEFLGDDPVVFIGRTAFIAH